MQHPEPQAAGPQDGRGAADLAVYPFPPEAPCRSSRALGRYRDAGLVLPVVLDGDGPAWLVTSYALAKQVLGDPRFAIWFPGMPTDRVFDEAAGRLFVMNGPAH